MIRIHFFLAEIPVHCVLSNMFALEYNFGSLECYLKKKKVKRPQNNKVVLSVVCKQEMSVSCFLVNRLPLLSTLGYVTMLQRQLCRCYCFFFQSIALHFEFCVLIIKAIFFFYIFIFILVVKKNWV